MGLALVVGLAVPIAQALADFRCATFDYLTKSLTHYAYSIFALGLFPWRQYNLTHSK